MSEYEYEETEYPDPDALIEAASQAARQAAAEASAGAVGAYAAAMYQAQSAKESGEMAERVAGQLRARHADWEQLAPHVIQAAASQPGFLPDGGTEAQTFASLDRLTRVVREDLHTQRESQLDRAAADKWDKIRNAGGVKASNMFDV
jgi:hypothetical protein